jgi:hypothetical protein
VLEWGGADGEAKGAPYVIHRNAITVYCTQGKPGNKALTVFELVLLQIGLEYLAVDF